MSIELASFYQDFFVDYDDIRYPTDEEISVIWGYRLNGVDTEVVDDEDDGFIGCDASG